MSNANYGATGSGGTVALVAVVGVIGVGLWYLFGPIPRQLQRYVHENPLSTPTTRGKKVAYRLHLSQDTVRMAPSGNALIFRNGALLAQFTPLPHQLAKIRSGEGVLLVFTDQLLG